MKNFSRIHLHNGSWFCPETSQCFGEKTFFDGSNEISVCTNSECQHQCLYLTIKGNWVLHHWNAKCIQQMRYCVITIQEARDWFVLNNYPIHEIPEMFHEAIADMEL